MAVTTIAEVKKLWAEKEQLYKEIDFKQKRIKEINEATYLNEIKWYDDVPGSNFNEYQCIHCKKIYHSVQKGICSNCHPLD